jgi:hypothetical protein
MGKNEDAPERKSPRAHIARAAVHVAGNPTWVFAIVVAMSVLSSATSILYMRELDDDLGGIYEKDVRGHFYAQNAYATVLAIESTAKDLVLAEDAAGRSASAESLRSQSLALRGLVQKAAPTFDSGKYRTLLANTKAETADLGDYIAEELEGLDAQGMTTESPALARVLLEGIRERSPALKGDLVKLYDVKRRSSLAWFKAVRLQLKVSLLITVAIFLVSIGLRIFLYRGQKRAAAGSRNIDS